MLEQNQENAQKIKKMLKDARCREADDLVSVGSGLKEKVQVTSDLKIHVHIKNED